MSAAEQITEDAPIPTGMVVDLRAWMARWNYTQGMQFVRLERISPSEWPAGSRQSIAGSLEDLYEPLDSFDIAGRWGGGVYTVSAVQVGEANNRRIVERKRIELAGPPRCIPGPDGRPMPIPQPSGNPTWPTQPTAPAAAPQILEFQQMLSRATATATEANSIGVIKDAFKDAHRQAEERDRAHRLEVAELRKEMAKNAENRDQPVRDAMAAQQRQFDRVIEAHSSQLDALRSQHETQLAALTRNMEKTLEARETTHRAEMTALRDAQRQETAAIRDTHRIETEGLKRDLDRERSERDRDVRDLRSALDAARAEATASGDRRAAEARDNARAMYEPQLAQLRGELADARKFAETMRQDGRDDLNRREADIRAQLEAVGLAKEAAIRGSLEAQLHALTADIRSRDERLARQDEELVRLRELAMQKADPTSSLKAAHELRDMVLSATGMSGQPGPQGILQTLASVAGPLRENLVEPVLKRVDQGMQIAEQESNRRFQAQQIMFNRQGGQSRRVTQRQVSGPSGRPRPVQQRRQQQRAPASAAAPVQPPASANPQARDGAVMFLRQLEAWLGDGTTTEVAAGQIRAAVQAGQLPADVLQGILNQQTRDLVKDVSATAQQLGLSALASPRGEDYVTALHKLLRRG